MYPLFDHWTYKFTIFFSCARARARARPRPPLFAILFYSFWICSWLHLTKYSCFFYLFQSLTEELKYSLHVSSHSHGDNAKMILLIHPNQKVFIIGMPEKDHFERKYYWVEGALPNFIYTVTDWGNHKDTLTLTHTHPHPYPHTVVHDHPPRTSIVLSFVPVLNTLPCTRMTSEDRWEQRTDSQGPIVPIEKCPRRVWPSLYAHTHTHCVRCILRTSFVVGLKLFFRHLPLDLYTFQPRTFADNNRQPRTHCSPLL